MMWVAKMRERDANLYAHGLSVAVSLVAFGRHLGYPKAQLSQLGMLGFLLDIGKIKVPRDILEKTGRLSPMEFSIVREHVRLGLEILAQTPTLHPDIVEGIAQHHERLDGTGYPGKLASEGISVFGRMAAIADTFAAMTRERPYADAMSAHEALQKLSNWGGTQFQAEMVDQFIQSIGVFPVGSLVELSSGELAIVVTHNKHKRLRPKVLVVTDADKVAREIPAMLDLIYDVSEKPIYIRRGLAGNAHGIDPREYYLS
jgi:HD-GYP domain-containing protein (c-di-GMP phosphodiesterase class II)